MRLAWELTINAVEVWIIYDFLVRYFGYRASGAAKYAGTVLCVGMAKIPKKKVPLRGADIRSDA